MEAACPDILEVLMSPVGEFFRVLAEIQKHNSMIKVLIIIIITFYAQHAISPFSGIFTTLSIIAATVVHLYKHAINSTCIWK